MESFKNILLFGKHHSTSVVVTLLITAFAGKGDNFIFSESPLNQHERLNLAFLATSRAILVLLMSYIMQLTFIPRPPKQQASGTLINSSSSNTRYVLIDIVSVITSFWVPVILLNSIFTLLVFVVPFALATCLSLRFYLYFSGSRSENHQQGEMMDSSSLSTVEASPEMDSSSLSTVEASPEMDFSSLSTVEANPEPNVDNPSNPEEPMTLTNTSSPPSPEKPMTLGTRTRSGRVHRVISEDEMASPNTRSSGRRSTSTDRRSKEASRNTSVSRRCSQR